MNRDHDDDFDDDDFDERGILKDGRSVKVAVQFMDAEAIEMLRQKYQGHRPGFILDADSDARDEAEDAHAAYVKFLQDGYRTAAIVDEPERPTSFRNALAAADQAREERDQWLRDAYKGGQP